MSGLEKVGSTVATAYGVSVEVEVGYEWQGAEPAETFLIVGGTTAYLTEAETLEVATWLLQCLKNKHEQSGRRPSAGLEGSEVEVPDTSNAVIAPLAPPSA
jgi:hypothetical protein